MRLPLVLGILGSFCQAQPVPQRLTLADALRQAVEQNGVRQSYQQRVEAAAGHQMQAGLKPNALLTFQSENTRFWDSPSFVYPRDADTFLFLTQRIESGGKRERRVEFAGENVRRAEAERELFERQLKLRVRAAYWQAAGAEQLSRVAGEQVTSFASLVENNRARVKEGVLAEGDLMRSEIELRRIEAARDLASGDARRLRAQLFREMGFAGPADFELDPLEPGPSLEAVAPDSANRPELRLAQTVVRAAEANVKLQRANDVPDPSIVYGYKRTAGYDTFVGGLQIDLRFRKRNYGAIVAAEAEARAATWQTKAVTALVDAEARTARIDYETRRKLATETLPRIRQSAAESMRLTRGAYQEGGVDLLRLIDAERLYLETETQYVRALADLKQAEATLEYALGVDR